MKLENKVAIVTGGGRGMGRAMALRFAREGARVVIAEVDRESGDKTFADIGKCGLLMRTDIAKFAEIDELLTRTVAELGQVDILVNNAGVTKSLGFFDVTESDWDWMYSVNARGVFFCMQRAKWLNASPAKSSISRRSRARAFAAPRTSHTRAPRERSSR